jgi:sigma-E factor negative regulatory protein RseB
MMLRHLLSCFAACLAGAAAPAWAQAAPADPASVLQRIGTAARQLSYSGVFVHSSRDRTTTSRIIHISDRGEEWEWTEYLDGPAHEIIRRNEELYCYQPESKTIRIDRRISGKFFPSLLNGAPQTVMENYNVKIGPVERIGGHDCQWLVLEPKDSLRFLQELCAETGSGLLLRARTFNDRNQILEQFTFTELKLGKEAARDFSRGHIKSRLHVKQDGWQTDDSAQREMKNTETGWVVTNPPAGFRKVMEMQRTMAGKIQPVSHLVFSDGMASISVFVEPLPSGTKGYSQAAEDGMGSYALRTVADHQVTVLGEVPLGAAQLLANGVGPKAR